LGEDDIYRLTVFEINKWALKIMRNSLLYLRQ
jgi:hypothetical protein